MLVIQLLKSNIPHVKNKIQTYFDMITMSHNVERIKPIETVLLLKSF